MPVAESPFHYGRELTSQELVDRESELAEVVDVLRSAGRLFMIGPRRFGKTSILRVAANRAVEEGILVLRYNLESYNDLTRLAQTIIADAAPVLKGPVTKIREKVEEIFSTLRPRLNYNPFTEAWSVTLAPERPTDPDSPILADTLHGVEKLCHAAGRNIGIIFDEFQEVLELGGAREEARLRAAVQEHLRIAYVFAGSDTRLLSDMTSNPSRPFYRLGERLFIGQIPREDFRESLLGRFKSSGIDAELEGVEAILDLAQDVPYNVQRLSHACWSAVPPGSQLVAADVTEVLEDLVRRDAPFYTQIWTGLTARQQRALSILAESDGTGLFAADSLRRAEMTAGTMNTSLDALRRQRIIRTEETVNSTRYLLEDPFLAVWLRIFIPPLE